MKMCSCCGRENDAGAIQCREGGNSFVTPAAECPSKESPLPISLRQRIGMWVAAIEATGASVQRSWHSVPVDFLWPPPLRAPSN